MVGGAATRRFTPPHRRAHRNNNTHTEPHHVQAVPSPTIGHGIAHAATDEARTTMVERDPPQRFHKSHTAQTDLRQESQPSPGLAHRPKPSSPLRGKNDRWIKDSDLKSGRWMANYQRDQLKNKDLRKTHKPDLSNWDNSTAWDTPNTAWDLPNGASLDQSYSLVNFDGSWAPAPDDWDSRPAFGNLQSAENIYQWLEVAHAAHVDDPLGFIIRDPRSTNFHQSIPGEAGATKRYYFSRPQGEDNVSIMGDVVPIYWRPPPMDGRSSLSEFWSDHLKAPPTPWDLEDLVDVKPWWDYCPSPMACFQLPLQHPEHRGVDVTDESKLERRARELDQSSSHQIRRWNEGYRGGRGGRGGDRFKFVRGRGGREASEGRAKATPTEESIKPNSIPETTFEPIPDLSIQPKANLYLRRAQVSDMTQVTQIYNHYVGNSLRVPETAPVLPSHMHNRLRNITNVSHYFLVACLAGGPSNKPTYKGPGKRNKALAMASTDRVIGFVYFDDFSDPSGMYRFLAEVEVFTDPEFLHKGVASCLMDKLIAILDPYYLEHGGYEVRDDDLGRESTRLVNCLWINFPYVPEEDEKEWATKWLNSIGFEQTGHFKNIAFKLGKSGDLAVFTRPTGCEINPANPPADYNF